MYKKADRAAFMAALSREFPDPKSELNFTTPFELLVAVVLSAQTTDKAVNVVTAKLFPLANTPQGLIALGEQTIADTISSIGLFKAKTRHIVGLSEMILDQFKGEVPRTREELMTLPGVGRKTANVVLNVAFGEPTFAVDTHVFRVCNRTGYAKGETPADVEALLEKYVPEPYRLNAHHYLLLHGRYICTARSPSCGECQVADFCRCREHRDWMKANNVAPKKPKVVKPEPVVEAPAQPGVEVRKLIKR